MGPGSSVRLFLFASALKNKADFRPGYGELEGKGPDRADENRGLNSDDLDLFSQKNKYF